MTLLRRLLYLGAVCLVISWAGSTVGHAEDGRGWADIAVRVAGEVFLDAEQDVMFYGFDTLAHPNSVVELSTKLRTNKVLEDIEGATIGFYRDPNHMVGAAVTDDDGVATIQWPAPSAGDFTFTARILEAPEEDRAGLLKVTPAEVLVCVRPEDTEFVVIDLDHTVVASNFFRVLVGGAKPMPDSVAVTHRIAKKYSIVYLTHRPDLLTLKSKTWLRAHGYPRGPLLTGRTRDTFGSSGKFKTGRLAMLRGDFQEVSIGIGDKLSDAQAYVDNGMTAYLIPHYKAKAKNMRRMAREIRELRGRGRLQVVSNWREIEAGFFEGKTYPPEAFADWLEERAGELERLEEEEDDD